MVVLMVVLSGADADAEVAIGFNFVVVVAPIVSVYFLRTNCAVAADTFVEFSRKKKN